MRIAVVGSRNYPCMYRVRQFVDTLPADTTVVSGRARGVDIIAADRARLRNLVVEEFPPDYARYGRYAPLMRNTRIVDTAEIVVAFWDGVSRGTKDAIDKAWQQGKAVYLL